MTQPSPIARPWRSRASRRDCLRALCAVAGSALAPPWPRAAQAAAAALETVRISDRLAAVIGADATVLCADSDDGVVMVDGGHATWAGALLETVGRTFAGKPVRALINTHWHDEQTGSNEMLGQRGVEIIAHENTALWLGSEVWVRWSDRRYPPLPAIARPTTTFYDSGSAKIGGRLVEYGYMPKAHTDGDISVFFPDENVLVAGGFVSNDGWPVIDWWTGGWTIGMLDGFDRLLEIANDDTRIVPARGPLMSLAELKTQYEMYKTVFDRIHEMLRKSYGTAEVLAAKPTAEFDVAYGDPTLFLTLAFQSTWGHLRDAHDQRLRNTA